MNGEHFIVNKVAIIQSILFSRPIKSSPEITAKAQPPCFPARCQRLCTRVVFLYLKEYHINRKSILNTEEYFSVASSICLAMYSTENGASHLVK